MTVLPTRDDWLAAQPFPHVVIDDWLDPALADEAASEFPPADSGLWHRFTGPLEDGKLEASAEVCGYGVAEIHETLASGVFVEWLRLLTGDEHLVADEHKLGAGVHGMAAGARLGWHTDFTVHPTSGLVRRVNTIVYLNDGWERSWGGATMLHGDGEVWRNEWSRQCEVEAVFPARGRLVVFQSSPGLWHGVPQPLTCPPGVLRKTIPAYYYSPARDGEQVEATSTVFADG